MSDMKGAPEDPERTHPAAGPSDREPGHDTATIQHSLHAWDHAEYLTLQERDLELYRLICDQVGRELDILLGHRSVKLGYGQHRIELTWNGDDEDLVDLVLGGVEMLDNQR